jgi:hypothetical protein
LWLVVGFEPLPLPLPLFFFLWGFLAFVFFAAGLVDFFSEPPGLPLGGAWLEVVLVVLVDELELELDDDDEEEEAAEDDEEELVVEVVVVVVPVPDVHTSLTDDTGRFAGTIDEIETPTGTLKVRPPTVVTCQLQLEADTAGVQAPRPAITLAVSPTRSFGLLNTLASLLPRFDCSQPSSRDLRAA